MRDHRGPYRIATDAFRNAAGIGSGTAPRESGAAMTSESKRLIALSSAMSPIGSGSSQASTAAVAAFFAPSRWKLDENHRQIDGRGR